ncbi:Acetylglutamate kinase [Slackia heliotrinireducens]|uniref:Acetylglutamate kinase n=1 Tax=Slackia heliotrinireducens (strain ATCC 29202 / DSM 20476 / NCTC 11029 / RHS 1) TaxID=471855 RepID=C7N0Z0_SLAHD|nr:acetylglutamate kinase [Slackia heliotrinireducens]ACV23212.1 N-acetylglutamate kinase [Slackia heliotrinireducens DSM 20476]VEH02315.1 Acetylglutamate kinase [Slackia heliotrinireducens]
MKYTSDFRQILETQGAETLIEALPWFKDVTGKTVVIKYGGAAMEDPELMDSVMTDILLLKIIGVRPVIIHGGGKAINRMLDKLNVPVKFENGLRVTDDATMDVVKMVLTGDVNDQLVRAVNKHGNLAVGLSGSDAGTLKAVQKDPALGRVGKVSEIDPSYLNDLINADYIPIIASIAASADDDGVYNINADEAAGDIASAIGAHKIMFLTDVNGLYENYPDPDTLIAWMTQEEAEELIASGKIASGMIPKINAALHALKGGVPRAHILNGKIPHAILLEMLTDSGIGTMIRRADSADQLERHPLDRFTKRLSENLSIDPEGDEYEFEIVH